MKKARIEVDQDKTNATFVSKIRKTRKGLEWYSVSRVPSGNTSHVPNFPLRKPQVMMGFYATSANNNNY